MYPPSSNLDHPRIYEKGISRNLQGFDLFLSSFQGQPRRVSKGRWHERNDGEAPRCDCRCYKIERWNINNNVVIYKRKTIATNLEMEAISERKFKR